MIIIRGVTRRVNSVRGNYQIRWKICRCEIRMGEIKVTPSIRSFVPPRRLSVKKLGEAPKSVGNRGSRSAEFERSLTRNLNYSLRKSVSTSNTLAPEQWIIPFRATPPRQLTSPLNSRGWIRNICICVACGYTNFIIRLQVFTKYQFADASINRAQIETRDIPPVCCTKSAFGNSNS
ncbi:hypothetical protein PUN28_019287 [Cardiocondyla obscurior]|uniref:Uncharacterized protein n=1 Tax=Cardiocondyla obscurior TaxID=286306 RepID=A0AAW2EES1_9HYME